MAVDHGPPNIRVNCIAPGDTDTSMLRDEAKQLGEPLETFLKDAASRPLQRIGRPEEVAAAVLYLASEAASFVTGAILAAEGLLGGWRRVGGLIIDPAPVSFYNTDMICLYRYPCGFFRPDHDPPHVTAL